MPTAIKSFTTVGECSIVAAAESSAAPRVSIVAYTGGIIQPGGWGKAVIDLAGVELAQTVPILADHESRLQGIVGMGQPMLANNELHVAGNLLSTGVAKHIGEVSAAGFKFQASVGVDPITIRRLNANEKITVNGQTFTAPREGLIVLTRSVLREVSIVALGADRKTTVSIAASKGNATMPDELDTHEQPSPETIRAEERQRLIAIDRACAVRATASDVEKARVAQWRESAIAGDLSFEQLQANMLELLRGERATGPAIHTGGKAAEAPALTAALCLASGIDEKQVGEWYDERTMNAAVSRPMRATSIHSVFREVIQLAGLAMPRTFDSDGIKTAFQAERMLQAAGSYSGGFSTVSLTGILGEAAGKMMLSAYQNVAVTWPLFCAIESNSDFKNHTRYSLTGSGDFKEVGADGELKHFTLTEEAYTSKLATYGSMIALTRQMIKNDDLNAFGQLPRIIGRQSAIKLEKSVFTLLLSNPNNFFHASHKNLKTGAGSVLDIDGLTAAEQLFLDQVDANGDPILIAAKTLLVPTSLKTVANQICKETTIVQEPSGNKPKPASNPHAGRFTVGPTPWLNSQSLAGSSETAWYLFATPTDVAAMEVAFLDGRTMPTIESGDTDFNTLGMAWRGYFDFGVAMRDYRAAVKNIGAA